MQGQNKTKTNLNRIQLVALVCLLLLSCFAMCCEGAVQVAAAQKSSVRKVKVGYFDPPGRW